MKLEIEQKYRQLFDWCEKENFAGYDPFDGLNSKIFQATPLKYFALTRLAWLQTVKRSGKNLRPLLGIEKSVNVKGLALFALAELSVFRMTQNEMHAQNARNLIDRIVKLKIEEKDYIAFGYNFDWQSRAFFAPQGTPTIVPTAFVTQALFEGYEFFRDETYLQTIEKVCEFIKKGLNRIDETQQEVCFSYTPLDRSVIFNASLLAGECLANFGSITKDVLSFSLAQKSANFVINRQRKDGAWVYGAKKFQGWVDNFHTAFILLSLSRLQKQIPNFNCNETINKGLKYWIENLFLSDGTPKYYDREIFPVDIHSAAAAIVGLCELKDFDERCLPLAKKVTNWTIENMRSDEGYFYYQKRQNRIIETPFIRWGQAWMAYALAKFLEHQN